MNEMEKSLDDAIAFFDDLIDNPDRVLKLEPHTDPPVSKDYLISICKSIGCSMVNENCPGNPGCDILIKILRS